ncbi:MAG: hypothetical protein AB1797_03780 [bacterium]
MKIALIHKNFSHFPVLHLTPLISPFFMFLIYVPSPSAPPSEVCKAKKTLDKSGYIYYNVDKKVAREIFTEGGWKYDRS